VAAGLLRQQGGLLRHPSGSGALQTVPLAQSGFTLLEIMIVVMILGLVAMLVVPRLFSVLDGDARSASRDVAGLVAALVQEAVASHTIHRLTFDLETNEYWVTTLSQAGGVLEESPPVGAKRALPAEVRFEDVVTSHQGLVTEGRAFTQVFPSGIVTRTTIHLEEHDRSHYTLTVNPITGRVTVVDGYVEAKDAA
jgi:prepilin-type N-terminal cleavage/methylation domain-containing protein